MNRGITGVAQLFGPGGIDPKTFERQPTAGQERRAAQAALHQHQRDYDSTNYNARMTERRPDAITQAEAYPFDRLPYSLQQQQPQQQPQQPQQQPQQQQPQQQPNRIGRFRPAPLNISLTQFGAPNLRAAGYASRNGEASMLAFAKANDSTNPANYDLTAPENFGDNPFYDEANEYRLREPFQKKSGGGRTKKRRNTRRRSHKYKPKRKQQTRKKPFRKRK